MGELCLRLWVAGLGLSRRGWTGKGDHMRSSGVLASCRRGLVATLCLFGLFSLPAQAVVITVGGSDYDVTLSGPAVFYTSVRGGIVSQVPWWGSEALALQAAADFHTATGGDYGVTGGTNDVARFVYAESGPTIGDTNDAVLTIESSGLFGSATVSNSLSSGSTGAFAFATPVAVAVPEIDGNALAKALFILFALGAWLHTRRARAA